MLYYAQSLPRLIKFSSIVNKEKAQQVGFLLRDALANKDITAS
jgi:hypothetical protein